jgi:hypothetical protein
LQQTQEEEAVKKGSNILGRSRTAPHRNLTSRSFSSSPLWVRKDGTRSVDLRIENDTVRAFMTAFIVAFTIVHGWLQAFGLYLESLFSLSPPLPHHPSLLFACPPPSFCFRNPPTASQKTLLVEQKQQDTHQQRREKTPTPTPLLPNYFLCLSEFQCFFFLVNFVM